MSLYRNQCFTEHDSYQRLSSSHLLCVSKHRLLQQIPTATGLRGAKRDQNKICLYVIPYTGVDTKLPHRKIPLQLPPRYLVA